MVRTDALDETFEIESFPITSVLVVPAHELVVLRLHQLRYLRPERTEVAVGRCLR